MISLCRRYSQCSCLTACIAAALVTSIGMRARARGESETPIEHVIVIIGENRSFDHLFATYMPPQGESVWNLLSKGIVAAEGAPGANFAMAKQYRGVFQAPAKYSLVPASKTPYETLPPPNTDGTPSAGSDTKPPPFATLAAAAAVEGQALTKGDLPLLTTGSSGLPKQVIDTRILNVLNLPSGPFQLTPGVAYDDYAASPVHRFYQMWQQLDCSATQATGENRTGCLADLFPGLEASIVAGGKGKPQPANFNDE